MVAFPANAVPTRRFGALACFVVCAALLLGACSAESTIAVEDTASDTESSTNENTAAVDNADDSTAEDTVADDTAAEDAAAEDAAAEDPVESADESADADDLPTDMAAGDVIVRLLDAGSEPRQELRIDLAASCAELMIVDQTQELSQSLGELELPSAGPVQSIMTMRMTSTSLGPDGYEITAEIIEAVAGSDTDVATATAMNEQFEALKNVRTISQVTDRAVPIAGSARTEGTESLGLIGETMDQINGQLASPLPEEAVGVGASWEVINVLELQGLPITTRTVQTLDAIDGSVITLSTTATQSVPLGSIMSAPGIDLEVLAWENETSGSSIIDLQALVPVASSAEIDAVQSFATDETGGTLDQEIAMQMNITGELEDGCAARPGRARP